MSASRVAKAARRFARFTGHRARDATRVPFKIPKVAMAVGPLLAVEYETVRDGDRERYRHTFRARSRPMLAVTEDGRQLLIVSGRYLFTERGIVDK